MLRCDERDLHRGEAGGWRHEDHQRLGLATRGCDGGEERGAVHPGDAGAGRHHGECEVSVCHHPNRIKISISFPDNRDREGEVRFLGIFVITKIQY